MRSKRLALIAFALFAAGCVPAAQPASSAVSSALAAVSTSQPVGATSTAAPSASASTIDVPFVAGPIQLLDPNTGWATINSGLVNTTDGGGTWHGVFLTPNAAFASLRFVDRDVGWAVLFRYGTDASCAAPALHAPCWSVVTTADGGRTWRDRLSTPGNGTGTPTILSLQAIDDQRAWVIVATTDCNTTGCADELRATDDGGRTWQIQLRGRPSLGPLRFATARHGWVASGRPGDTSGGMDVLVTDDGGASWGRSFSAADPVLDIDAASERQAWILTRDGAFCTSSDCSRYQLLRTTDGGATWSGLGNPKESATCSGGHLSGPLFASANVGWFGIGLGAGGVTGSRGGTMRTTDAGVTWDCKPFPTNTTALSTADPLHVWARSDDRQGGSSLYSTIDGGASCHRIGSATVRPTIIPPMTPAGLLLPARCRYVGFTDGTVTQSWDIDCGASNDARGLFTPPLVDAGWTSCGFGLAAARWRKDGFDLGISETASPDDPIRLLQLGANGPCG